MITYDFTKHAERGFRKLPRQARSDVIDKIEEYCRSPDPLSRAKCIGRYGKRLLYRFRAGDLRIIFEWETRSILIGRVDWRRNKGLYR